MPCIAIDTNIFVHLKNPSENHDSHIDRLLKTLANNKYHLLVDSTRKIGNEYQQKILPMMENMDDTGQQLYLLRYWMNFDIRQEVVVDRNDELMRRIKKVINEIEEHADRAFVYIAFHENSTLITNDNEHILGRRVRLWQQTEGLRRPDSQIWSSTQASTQFCGGGGQA